MRGVQSSRLQARSGARTATPIAFSSAGAMTGKSLVEGLAGLVTAGATIPAAVMSATVAVIEAFSAAWNIMMTAASGTIALGAGLGAATQEIEFVRLPEV